MNWTKYRAFQIASWRAVRRFDGLAGFRRLLNSKPRALKLFTQWAVSEDGWAVVNAATDPNDPNHSRVMSIRAEAKQIAGL